MPGNQVTEDNAPTTPVTAEGLRAFFEGLCAIQPVLMRGAPSSTVIAVTPGFYELLESEFGRDPRFKSVAGELVIASRKELLDAQKRFVDAGGPHPWLPWR
jgi:hypothetical protein